MEHRHAVHQHVARAHVVLDTAGNHARPQAAVADGDQLGRAGRATGAEQHDRQFRGIAGHARFGQRRVLQQGFVFVAEHPQSQAKLLGGRLARAGRDQPAGIAGRQHFFQFGNGTAEIQRHADPAAALARQQDLHVLDFIEGQQGDAVALFQAGGQQCIAQALDALVQFTEGEVAIVAVRNMFNQAGLVRKPGQACQENVRNDEAHAWRFSR